MTFNRAFVISAAFCAVFWVAIVVLALKLWP